MKNRYFFNKSKSLSENIKSFSTIDHKAYVFYKDKSKLNNRELVAHFVEYGKLISEFYKIVSEELVESRGGVYIKGFGYIGMLKYFTSEDVNTKRTRTYKDPTTDENYKVLGTKEDYYWIGFVPITKTNYFRTYSLDKSCPALLRKMLINACNKGYNYKFNASLFFKDIKQTKNITY